METAKLKKFAQLARNSLIEQISAKLQMVLAENSAARRESTEAIKKLEEEIKEHGKDQVIERAAYIWFNRFCALRFMDVNRYNRVNIVSPSNPGQFQPEILAEAKMGHINEEMVHDKVRQQVFALLDGKAPSRDPQAEAYRLLVVAACNYWNRPMPFLFEKIADYTELLMPDDLLSGNSILASTREAMTPDACTDVEILGWLYQFYISERKDQVMARKSAVPTEDIPAVTQLFTPHWIVRYLVENSLGRLWLLNHPQSKLRDHMPYYIEESGAGVSPAKSESGAGVSPAKSESGAGVSPAITKQETGETPAPLSFQPFIPWEEIETTRRCLPHWQQEGTTYFITFRLGDSIPQEKLALWAAEQKQWLAAHPEPWDSSTLAEYTKLFPERRQQWLDNGYGRCLLQLPAIAEIVRSALLHFDGQRYLLDEFVLMPNHVHLLVKPLPGHDLSALLHSWKSFTAKAINKAIGATGTVWQDERYDHIVRSTAQLEFYRSYIRENPIKAGLKQVQAESGAGVPPATASSPCTAGETPAPRSIQTESGAGVSPAKSEAGKKPAPLFLKITKPEEIRLCDPACGSGHMLTYAFDLLTLIYEEEGYAPAEIPALILRHNLYGLEICPRAAQLAELALVFKAREKSRRFFQPEHLVRPHIIELRDVRFAENELRDYIHALGLGDLFNQPVLKLLHQFEEAKNFGSLIQPCMTETEICSVRSQIENQQSAIGNAQGQLFLRETHLKVLRVLEQAEALTQRYHVVVANPPYFGPKQMNEALREFAKEKLPDSKADLYAMFMERSFNLALPRGYVAMVVMQSWMFLHSFEKLRIKLLREKTILSMAHLGPRAFATISGEIVTVTAWCFSNARFADYRATFCRLIDGNESDKKTNFLAGRGRYPNVSQDSFSEIPGSPIAYWIGAQLRAAFRGSSLEESTISDGQNKTADNGRFVREHWEVSVESVGRGKKWLPYAKGGPFRRWSGNLESVVDWSEKARQHYRKSAACRIVPEYLWYKLGITWSRVGTGLQGFRLLPPDSTFDMVGSSVFLKSDADLGFLLGLLNTPVTQNVLELLNPSIDLQVKDIRNVPIPPIIERQQVEKLVTELLVISENDWDSSETSLHFRDQPLLRPGLKGATLEASWRNWEAQSTAAIRRMQELETENNRLFIAAYGLDGELQPEVPEAQITLARAEARRDMAAFLSYAVGCMMGRYSPDHPGLILANAGDTLREFLEKVGKPLAELTFAPDADGVIPILDGEWFPDDITERFKKFLRVTFGEAHLEENIRFIESSLGKSIRKYFLTDFYKDHVQTYKKRPIYWLFSSPKGSFNALIYMHRYRPDTVSVVLNDYLREFRTKLTSQKSRMEALSISASASQGEKTKALKEIEKLNKVIAEMVEYERDVLYPLATEQIAIDLDDGVKVNYPKFYPAVKKIVGLDTSEED